MGSFFTSLGSRITSTDVSILSWLQHVCKGHFMDTVMPMVTKLGDIGILWIVIALILLIFKKTRKTGASMAVALILGLIFGNGLLKHLVARPRPFEAASCVIPKDKLLIPAPGETSFPSGHALSSFAAATAIYRDHSVLGFIAYVVAGLIAFSRLYLCVHYPSDVLGGIIVGMLMGLLGCKIVRLCTDMHASRLKKKAEKAAEK